MVTHSLAILDSAEELSKRFEAKNNIRNFKPSMSIQSCQLVPVVRQTSNKKELTLDMLSWGTVLNNHLSTCKIQYASASQYGQPIYNQRFHRRCLIPANMLYSYIPGGSEVAVEVFSFLRSYSNLVALAGIWDSCEKNYKKMESFFILNAHDPERREFFNPVVVNNLYWSSWLGVGSYDLSPILHPYTFLSRKADRYIPQICRVASD